jgi:indole-3-glycerol phosphate synthase
MTQRRGVLDTGSVLDRIVADARGPLEQRKREVPAATLLVDSRFEPGRGLSEAISRLPDGSPRTRMAIIAEIKKASPSRGVLTGNLNHRRVALDYANGGATGISVLTEVNHFAGDLGWLRDVRETLDAEIGTARPSLLRKDFTFDAYQIAEARAYGADNVLLIVAMLDDALLRSLLDEARGLGLDALVEVHTPEEAERAVKAGASLYGINNRDLHTFAVDLATTERIRPLLPSDAIVVGESGVHTRADAARLQAAGVSAILVGEAFMTARDIAAKMRELLP